MRAALTWFSGAKKDEQGKVLLTFLALFCLLVSYYLIKPLRNSKFLEEFHPSRLPFVYAGVAVLSFFVTKIFSHLAERVEKYKLVIWAYVTIIFCKLGLGFWLQVGGKASVICFYFFASVYFLLALATLWACINDMFRPEESERCFGFVAIGSTLGGSLGSTISLAIARSEYRDYTLYFSVIFMIVALVLVMAAAKQHRGHSGERPKSPRKPPENDFWGELKALALRPYLRRIGLTVLFLAVATTAIELVSQASVDRELARVQYQKHFQRLGNADFQDIYILKTKSELERKAYLEQLAQGNGSNEEEMQNLYKNYRKDLEGETRAFFAKTYGVQGLVGVLSLLLVARFLFPNVGMRYCYIILPAIALIGILLLGFTADIVLIQCVLVAVGAANYSLNNAAKEILFTATDEETLFRFKPMIEGPCMRTGDVVSSILKLVIGAVAASYALSQVSENGLFLAVTSVVLAFWIRTAWLAGKEYDEMRKLDRLSDPGQS